MTSPRWNHLMGDDDAQLDEAEIAEGWRWCWEFDSLLVGPGSSELHCCHCLEPDHPVYQTKPPMEDAIIYEGDL